MAILCALIEVRMGGPGSSPKLFGGHHWSAIVVRMNSRSLVGMVTGAALMLVFGGLWLFLGVLSGPLPSWVRTVLLLTGLLLAGGGGVTAKKVVTRSHAASLPTEVENVRGRQIRRRFGWISGLAGVAIFVVVLSLNLAHRPKAIPPVLAIIVGLHFFPLARLFRAPLYYATGALGCVIGVIGLLISQSSLRNSFVGIAFGLLLWLTTAMVLMQVSRLNRT